MPKNPFLYWGLLIVVGAGAIWAGHWLALRIVWVVPYAIGVGILLMLVGLVLESRKRQAAAAPAAILPSGVPGETSVAETEPPTKV